MFGKGVTVGRIFGITLILDWGLSVLAVLLAVNLGFGLLPMWHPDWSPLLRMSVALAAAVAFLLSVLAHEMSHALVGRLYGVKIRSITLFIFGGAANMEEEPPSAKAEFFMAAVGPLASLLIGVICTLLALPGASAAAERGTDAMSTLAGLGPVTTILLWLGPTNVVLGIFNLLPGYPLDGGRILRAILWGITHNILTATRWAAGVGRGIAWTLIALGALMALGVSVPYLGSGFAQGIWLAFIGWFLSNAALLSYRRLALQETLGKVPVRSIMRADVTSVSPDLDVATFAHELLLQSDQRAFPVVEHEQLVGLVSKREIEKLPRSAWSASRISDIMVRPPELQVIAPDDDSAKALMRLAGSDIEQLTVVEDGRVQGML